MLLSKQPATAADRDQPLPDGSPQPALSPQFASLVGAGVMLLLMVKMGNFFHNLPNVSGLSQDRRDPGGRGPVGVAGVGGAGEIGQWLRALADLPEEPRGLTTVYNSSSKGCGALFCPPQAPHTCDTYTYMQTNTHTHKNE